MAGIRPGSAALLDTENLNDLNKAFQNRNSILQDDAYTFGTGPNAVSVSEEELVDGIVSDVASSLTGFEGSVELPGLQANRKMLMGAVAKFKDDVHEGNIRRPVDAGHDDIVVQFADQTVYGQHTHQAARVFQRQVSRARGSGTPGGTLNVAPVGVNAPTGMTGTLDADEWLFFTGDFIDLSADAGVTRTQYVSIDGEDWEPESHYFSERDTDAQVNTISGALAKSTYDIDALLSLGTVTTEYVPVAFQIARGNVLPGNALGGAG